MCPAPPDPFSDKVNYIDQRGDVVWVDDFDTLEEQESECEDAGGLYIVRRLAIDFDEFNDRVHQEHVDNDRSLALDLIRLGVEEIILVTNDTTEHPRNDGKIVFVKPYKSPADIIDGRIGFYNQQSGFYDLDLATASWYQLNAAAQHELERYQQSALTDFSNGQSSLDIQDLVTWAIPSIKYAEMVQE